MNIRDRTRQSAIQYLSEHGKWPSVQHVMDLIGQGSKKTVQDALEQCKKEIAQQLDPKTHNIPAHIIDAAKTLYESAHAEVSKQYQEELQILNTRQTQANTTIKELQHRCEQLTEDVYQLDGQLLQVGQQRDIQQEELKQVRNQLEMLKKTHQQTHITLEQKEALFSKEKQQIEAQASRDQKNFEDQLRQLLDRLNTETRKLESEISQQKQQYGRLEQQRGVLENQLHEHTFQRQSLEKQLQQALEEKRRAADYHLSQEKKLQILEGELAREQQHITIVTDKLHQAQNESQRLQEQLELLRREGVKIRQENRRHEQENQRLRQENTRLLSEVSIQEKKKARAVRDQLISAHNKTNRNQPDKNPRK